MDCKMKKIISGHSLRETGAGGLLRFGLASFRLWAVALSLFIVLLPAVSEALSLSVSPSVAMPGQTVTITDSVGNGSVIIVEFVEGSEIRLCNDEFETHKSPF